MMDLILWVDTLTFKELMMVYALFCLCMVAVVNLFCKIVDAIW
jgi:hypothetical protein